MGTRHHTRGFTLVEFLMAGSLTVVVGGLLTVTLMGTTSSWSRTTRLIELDSAGSVAMHTVRSLLRRAFLTQADTVAGFGRISYLTGSQFDAFTGKVRYDQERRMVVVDLGGGVKELVVQDQNGTTVRRLVRGVTAFNVADRSIDSSLKDGELRVKMTVTVPAAGRDLEVTSLISMRNLTEFLLLKEAEASAGGIGAWVTGLEASASAGAYIEMPAASTGPAFVWYTVTVPRSGPYTLWVRGRRTGGGEVSIPYSVQLNAGPLRFWNEVFATTWSWYQVDTFTLSAGAHTLKFSREQNRQALDRILITSDPSFVPTF